MKFDLGRLKATRHHDSERSWPGYLLAGRIRSTTVALVLAFVVLLWAYNTHRATPETDHSPQVVPPGFIPDPNYTWVPRTRLQQPPPTITETLAPSTVTQTVTPTPEPFPPGFSWPPPAGPPPPEPGMPPEAPPFGVPPPEAPPFGVPPPEVPPGAPPPEPPPGAPGAPPPP